MAKFEALHGLKDLVVPWIEKDETGKIIRDQSVTFKKGLRNNKEVIPASLITTEPDLLKHLRSYGGNEKNGGSSFREIITEAVKETVKAKTEPVAAKPTPEPTPEPEAPKAPEPTPTPEPVQDPEPVQEPQPVQDPEPASTEAKTEGKVFEEPTTVQAASAVLGELFPDIKSRDRNSREKVDAIAAANNISFPNLPNK